MTDLVTLPVLPLRNTVLYPGIAVPISAGRPGTLRAIEAATEGDQMLFAVAQRENVDEPEPDLLYRFGTVVRILQQQQMGDGLQLLVQGVSRAQVLGFDVEDDGMIAATIDEVDTRPPPDEDDPVFQALDRELRNRATELGTKRGAPVEILNQLIRGIDNPGAFADFVAFYIDLEMTRKQELLELLDDRERMRTVLVEVERELARIEAQRDIQEKVKEELGERQREMLLREQLKKIQSELGETDEWNEAEELRDQLEDLDLPPEAAREVERELRRLERTSPQSSEHQVIRTFLEWVGDLPWSERSEERIDLAEAERILEEEHYGLQDVKDRVLEFLAVRKLQLERAEKDGNGKTKGRSPILLFDGPPGVGKTSIAKSIAQAIGREYVRISLGGARDEADIRGHRRTYVGAMPGRIIQGMRQVKAKNPVFLLDEIDKLGVSYQGDPSAALLEVLDPAQNEHFTDHYLGIPFDLSEVMFIATANEVDRIPGPLLDRMERVAFSGYTEQEKLEIAKRYLLPRQLSENGLRAEELHVDDDALLRVVQQYTHEAGVRQLERELGKLCRRVARRIAGGTATEVDVVPAELRKLVGRPRVHPERMRAEAAPGVSTGMFYTPMGGDILFVEASVVEGAGKLVLTGQLGEVMKESARAALTYAKSHRRELGISDVNLESKEIHIHVPAGAVPKDGPSAGITIAVALASALSGRHVRNDVSMTGELTLTGRVLPVGGIKEKVLGAVRAGIREIILPEANVADLEDIPATVRDLLTIHPVEHLDQVMEVALRGEGHPPLEGPDSGDQQPRVSA